MSQLSAAAGLETRGTHHVSYPTGTSTEQTASSPANTIPIMAEVLAHTAYWPAVRGQLTHTNLSGQMGLQYGSTVWK